ncbi:hypothetical protein F0562_015832 [Nyssa sinensis]|uniref:Homeobox domain-containing protein n=1 Tax=Nyssa sinensis TaxID=561372 RepID=A0A5J4ZI90_9ASTE|nr:hypothetical protein F0562_015832 [Nyssa sinensis]
MSFECTMELALSLGDTPKPFTFLDKIQKRFDKDLRFCMALGPVIRDENDRRRSSILDPPVQLDLLPFSPVPRNQPSSQLRFPWLTEKLIPAEPGSSDGQRRSGLYVNRLLREAVAVEEVEDAAVLSSPNSAVSSFQMGFALYRSGRSKRDLEASLNEAETERAASSRASDEEENRLSRKKLRLSKDQYVFLEESFKEHNTLNLKQKLALAKQLNLRPRQVEVWFQNRRARTKLKQTEVDCEYLKRYCETLTEENRRLQKDIQELRAFKTSQPFFMQPPATTLTMCPSCQRVVSTSSTAAAAEAAASTAMPFAKPKSYPFSQTQVRAHLAAS